MLRNAAIPTVTVLGVNVGYLVGGTLVVEQVFALPGLGQLMVNAIFNRDFPTVQGVTLVFALMVVRRQHAHRRRLCAPRSAGETSMTGDHPTEHRHRGRCRPSELGVAGRTLPSLRPWYRNTPLVAGLVIVGLLVLVAVLAPMITPHDPIQQNLTAILQSPTRRALLGTDKVGRDVLLAAALRQPASTCGSAFLAVLIPFVIGTVAGRAWPATSAVARHGLMRIVDVFFAFPFYVLVIALVFVLGSGERAASTSRSPRRQLGVLRAHRARRGARRQETQDYVARRTARRVVARSDHRRHIAAAT